jgi:hypothetical protein
MRYQADPHRHHDRLVIQYALPPRRARRRIVCRRQGRLALSVTVAERWFGTRRAVVRE